MNTAERIAEIKIHHVDCTVKNCDTMKVIAELEAAQAVIDRIRKRIEPPCVDDSLVYVFEIKKIIAPLNEKEK